jgi:phospholipase/lecithinase/hemolysin
MVHPILSLRLLAIAVLSSASTAPAATLFNRIFTFGDSLTDTGNTSLATGGALPGPGYDGGRFSNGPLWVETLADKIGIAAPTPSSLGGTGHAWAGAATGGFALPPSMQLQAQGYASSGGTFLPTDLVVVWGGANDFSDNPGANPIASANNISSIITTLAGAGARNFLVPNLPDLGDTPRSIATGNPLVIGALSGASMMFNMSLAASVPALEASLGINIRLLDVFSISKEIKADPGAYGITNTTLGALTSGNTASADQFAYWDDLHPTTRVHDLFANAAFAIIPEPSSAVLLCLSGAALLTRRTRRSRAA